MKGTTFMKRIYKSGKVEIWQCDGEWLVYGIMFSGDPVSCPSVGMAYEKAAGAA